MALCLFPIISSRKYSSLLKGFVFREIKGRFAGTFAGVLWTLINPMATIVVYMFLFSIVIRVPITVQETGTDSFLIFFLSGLFPWLILADSLNRSVGSLLGNADLITKVVFPVELIPTSAVLSGLIVNGIGMILFFIYTLTQGYLHLTWLWLVPLFFLQMLFTWGISMLLAALCVFVRDIQELLGIVLMVWFYGTPIIYPISLVPESMQQIFMINPMAIMIDMYRQAMLIHELNYTFFTSIAMLSLFVYVAGAWFFMRAKSAFGDIL